MATQVTLNSGSVDSAGSLLLKTNGTTTAVTIDTSQNMGLGVTPSAWTSGQALQISSGGVSLYSLSGGASLANNYTYNGGSKYVVTGYSTAYVQSSGAHQWYLAPSGSAGASISFTQAMTLDASGNLMVGRTSTTYKLDIKGNAGIRAIDTDDLRSLILTPPNSGGDAAFVESSSANGLVLRANNASGFIGFTTGGTTERARIDSSGNLLVGTTSTINSAVFTTKSSNSAASFYRSTTSSGFGITEWFSDIGGTQTSRAYMKADGGLANYSANNTNLSDERTKTDIQDAGNYLAKICAIPVRTFKYKDQTDDLLNLGCIAQEVETVAPELVDVSGFGEVPEDGVPLKAIYQTDLQYALMKCIQEQQVLIVSMREELDALKAKVGA